MASTLASYLDQLRVSYEEDRQAPLPDVDEKDLGDGREYAEDEDLRRGAILKRTVQEGDGETSPNESELVFLHYSVLGDDEKPLYSTRADQGGAGIPEPFVLGKDGRLPRGVHLAVLGMKRNERSLFTINPEYAFQHQDFSGTVPRGVDPSQSVVLDVQLTHWYPRQGVRVLGPRSDIYKRRLEDGEGWETPRTPFEVEFHLEARLPSTDGVMAESKPLLSTLQSEPIAASLGSGMLPSGLEAALQTMMRGERAVFICPVDTLDGLQGFNADEASEYPRVEAWIHMLDFSQVRDLSGDGCVMKSILRKGRGDFPVDCPVEDSGVQAHWRVKKFGAEEWVFDTLSEQEEPVQFETGMEMVPDVVDMAVRLMLRHEVASVRSTWKYSYEGRSDAPKGLSEGDVVVFEVELVDFVSERHWGDQSVDHRIGVARKWKEQGNTLFKQAKLKLAKVKYLKAIKAVDRSLHCETEEQENAALETKVACEVNLAMCATKQQEYGEAIHWCNKAVEDNPNHAKAYYRRGVAISYLGEFDAAKEDLELAAELDAAMKDDVERELMRMTIRKRSEEVKAKQQFANFFARQ